MPQFRTDVTRLVARYLWSFQNLFIIFGINNATLQYNPWGVVIFLFFTKGGDYEQFSVCHQGDL
jgi:hypothetical protein